MRKENLLRILVERPKGWTRAEIRASRNTMNRFNQERGRNLCFSFSSHSSTRHNIRSSLPGLMIKSMGLFLIGLKFSFQGKVNSSLLLEINVSDSGAKNDGNQVV